MLNAKNAAGDKQIVRRESVPPLILCSYCAYLALVFGVLCVPPAFKLRKTCKDSCCPSVACIGWLGNSGVASLGWQKNQATPNRPQQHTQPYCILNSAYFEIQVQMPNTAFAMVDLSRGSYRQDPSAITWRIWYIKTISKFIIISRPTQRKYEAISHSVRLIRY